MSGQFSEGEFACDQKNGSYAYMNGQSYSGDFKDCKFDGEGRYTWPWKTYTGTFKNNTMYGYGVMNWENGTIYDGLFLNDEFQLGQGIKIFPNRRYSGSLKKTKMHGQGVMTWTDGRNYSGKFEDDKI